MTAAPSRYADKPWLALLTEAQRAPLTPPDTLLHALRETVAAHPERPALAYFDWRLTYRELDGLSDSVAGRLAARGLRRGDRVAVLLQNSRTSCSPCSARGRRARSSCPSTRCTSRARSPTSSTTPGPPR